MNSHTMAVFFGLIFLVFCADANASPALDRASREIAGMSKTNKLDCAEILKDMELIAATNLPLAVRENDFERINEIYAKMMLIANTPPSNCLFWEETLPRYVRLEYQILQTIFEMREKWTEPNPLHDAGVLSGTDYENKSTSQEIRDPDLRERYAKWLKYQEQNRVKVLRDNILENKYRQKKQLLSGWLRDENYTPVVQEAVTNKALRKQLFPPTGIPRVMPVRMKKTEIKE
jgi:hypothetical protein